MRAVILGASGFLGSWTVRALRACGTNVVVLVRNESDLWRVAPLLDELTVLRAAPADWPEALAAAQADTVVSLDWSGVAGPDRDNPAQWQNLERLQGVFDAAEASGVRRFIGVGSQAEYGPREGVISENDPCLPTTEYGKAKLEAGNRLLARGVATGIQTAWVRVFSTFGPLDHSHWVLPTIAADLMANRVSLLTDGTQRWSYLSGVDAGRAFATIATAAECAGVYNLGHPEAPMLRSTIESFASHFGRHDLLRFGAIDRAANGITWLQPDVSRIEKLGWRADSDIAGALAVTADWLRGKDVADPLLPGLALPQSLGPSGLPTQ